MTVKTSPESDVTSHDWVADYMALSEEAGLVPLAAGTQVELRGEDRVTFLNRMCTQKVDSLTAGQGCEAFLTNARGRIVAYALVFAGAESLILHSARGQAEKLLTHLDYYLIREKVELHDRSMAWSELLLAGPKAEELLGRLVDVDLPREYLAHVAADLAGNRVSIRRLQMAGPATLLLSSDAKGGAEVSQYLQDAGARLCGSQVAEALRIEAGRPEYGRDISEENFPQEVARDERTISHDKGCYLGQETVARIDSRGHVNQFLTGLRFEMAKEVAVGTEVTSEGQVVGYVTSATFSPRLSSALALGYLRRGHHQPGSRLESAAGPVEVVSLPLTSPRPK
jgi:folate-binding protein YgfZ